MAEDTANAKERSDTGQRDRDICHCGELRDKNADDRADQAQNDTSDDRKQILHGDTPFKV